MLRKVKRISDSEMPDGLKLKAKQIRDHKEETKANQCEENDETIDLESATVAGKLELIISTDSIDSALVWKRINSSRHPV